jgi:hypothetical protein
MANVADRAIECSKSHNEIVTIDYDSEAETALAAACDDSVAANGVTEYWADDPDSETAMLWRVHMRAFAGVSKAQIESLRREAGEQGDEAMVHVCHVALGNREPGRGQPWPETREQALEECARVIAEAAGRADEVAS